MSTTSSDQVPSDKARSWVSEWGLWFFVLAIASAGMVWALDSVPYLPTNDGPEHILSGHIENHFNDPGTIYSKHLNALSQYAGRGFAFLYVPLEKAYGWRTATQTVLAIVLLFQAWGLAWLVSTIDSRRKWVALLPFAFGFSWTMYMGFFPYIVGMAFGTWIVAFVISRKSESLAQRVLVAAALGFQAHLHLFTALVTALFLTPIYLLRRPKEERPRELTACAATALPVLAVFAMTLRDQKNSPLVAGSDTYFGSIDERLTVLPHLLAPGPVWKGLLFLILAVVGIRSAMNRARNGSAHRDEQGLAYGAALFLALGFLLPLNIPGWQFFNPRFLILGATFAIPLLAIERDQPKEWTRIAAIAMGAITLISLVTTRDLNRQLSNGCAEDLSALDQPLKRSYVQLSMRLGTSCGVPIDPLESEIPYSNPQHHLACVYATQHGGTIPSLFEGHPAIHAFGAKEITEDLPIPQLQVPRAADLADPSLRETVMTYFTAHAPFYESFLVFGASKDDQNAILARGFTPRWQQGSFLIAEYQGCSVSLKVRPPKEPGKLVLSHGMAPLRDPVWSNTTNLKATNSVKVNFDRIGCGDVWVRAVFFGAARAYACKGSTVGGRMPVHASTSPSSIDCELIVPLGPAPQPQ